MIEEFAKKLVVGVRIQRQFGRFGIIISWTMGIVIVQGYSGIIVRYARYVPVCDWSLEPTASLYHTQNALEPYTRLYHFRNPGCSSGKHY